MNRQIFEILKIVKNSHQNTRGILFLVILTLFFHNSLFICILIVICSTLRDIQKPLSFRPYVEFTKSYHLYNC